MQTIIECHGVVNVVARKLGVTHQAISKRISTDADLQAARKEAEDVLLDAGESALARAVIDGQPWAVKFLLATKGKHRGWSRGLHIDANTQSQGVVHILELPDNGRDTRED